MATPQWIPGNLYQPGDLVQRRAGSTTVVSAPTNGNFNDGDTGWTFTAEWVITNNPGTPTFDGAYSLALLGDFIGATQAVNNNQVPVTPGQSITASCYIDTTAESHLGRMGGACSLFWYDASHTLLSRSDGLQIRRTSDGWQQSVVTDVAPPSAAFAAIGIAAFRSDDAYGLYADSFIWDYAYSAPPDGLVFRAVQADAGYSASTEPVWPTTLGDTVVDNQVTWEAVIASRVVWQATIILHSGSTEPIWPVIPGGHIVDNSISWEATAGQVTDAKCPNTVPVVIAASKVFAGDKDIIAFSATVNPLDWSSKDDAGYLPFGLQTYGSTPVTAMGLYRGNLVAFNSQSFQMWQVDQDPASMALLDAVPIGCVYPRSVQPLANDLLFLSKVGVRNVSIAGASTNLQADGVGEPIDSLVKAKLKTNAYEPIALFFPAQGQYWLIFGPEVFVLTINGAKAKSWSRYVYPQPITDWTIHENDLYLRAGTDQVWVVDEDALNDDSQESLTITMGALESGSFPGVFGYSSGNTLAGPAFGTVTPIVAVL